MNVLLLCCLWIISIICLSNGEYSPKRGNAPNRPKQRLPPSTLQQPPQQRELTDIQLIKYLSRNSHKHGSKQRPRRRPKPVYGPPDYTSGTPIGPPQKPPRPNYGPPKQTPYEQEPPQHVVSYFPSNDYDASQNQHNSFAEPPTPSTPRPKRPETNSDGTLPIQSDSSVNRLPPSTSYGTPVSPIINVYPDKLEYLKNNQPAQSLYNVFNQVPSLIPQTSYQPPLPNPPPVFNFAEPNFNSSLHTYNLPTGYYTGKDPYLSAGSIGEISEEVSSQYESDEEDEFSAEASEEIQPRPVLDNKNRRPTSHHSIFHAPTDQYVDDLLVFPKEPLGSSSSNVKTQHTSPFINNFNHNLDTEDLREHYSAGTTENRPTKTRKRSKRRKHPKTDTQKPVAFGTRIGIAKATSTTTTKPTPLNFVLLSSTNQKANIPMYNNEEYDLIPITTETIQSHNHNVVVQLSKSPQTYNNRENIDSISSDGKFHPKHRDTYATPDDEQQQPLLPTNNHPLAAALGQNYEIVSVEKSRSHSFYDGTITPVVLTKGTGNSVGTDQSEQNLPERILSDVIASIRV